MESANISQIEPKTSSYQLSQSKRQAVARTIHAQMKSQGARALKRFEDELSEVSQVHLNDAREVLRQVSSVGVLLTANLQRHAQRERLTIADVEALSKIWERMLSVTRRVLRLDTDQETKGSVRIGLFLQCGRPGEMPLQHAGMQHAGVAQSVPALLAATSCDVDTKSGVDNSVIHKLPRERDVDSVIQKLPKPRRVTRNGAGATSTSDASVVDV